jgi:hypothetical protein
MNTEDDIDPFTEELRLDLPSPEDEARVRLRLASAGVLAGAGVIVPSAATAATAVGNGMLAKLVALPLLAKVGAGVAVAALATVPVVVRVASSPAEPVRAPVTNVAAAAPPAMPAPRHEAPLVEAPSRTVSAAPEPVVVKAPAVAPRSAAAARAVEAAALPAPPAPATPAAPERVGPSVGSFDVPPTPVDEGTLRVETALMERALAAMQRGDFTTARRDLAEHARKFPNGHLAPERRRALERMLGKETNP